MKLKKRMKCASTTYRVYGGYRIELGPDGRRVWQKNDLQWAPFREEPSVYWGNGGYWFQKMRTYAEIKAYADSLDQGVRPRAKRSPSNLPTLWDDWAISEFETRSWKKTHRCRKQWMKNL